MTTSLNQARAAKLHAVEVFHRYGRVAGVGIKRVGDGFALKVNFETAPERMDRLPDSVDGVPVEFAVTGRIRAQD